MCPSRIYPIALLCLLVLCEPVVAHVDIQTSEGHRIIKSDSLSDYSILDFGKIQSVGQFPNDHNPNAILTQHTLFPWFSTTVIKDCLSTIEIRLSIEDYCCRFPLLELITPVLTP